MKKIRQLLWPTIMALYGLAIFILVHTDTLKYYIHPKLHVLTILSMVILFVLAYMTAEENIRKDITPALKGTYIVFLMPLLFFVVSSDADASRHVAAENGLRISATSKESTIVAEAESMEDIPRSEPEIANGTDKDRTSAVNGNTDSGQDITLTIPTEEESRQVASAGGSIYLNDDNFVAVIDDMHLNTQDYMGRHITYVGLIYKQDDFDPSELVIGRLMMYCCAADAQIIGLLSTSKEAEQYRDGDWVEIMGTVGEKEYLDPYTEHVDKIPYITIDAIRPAREPDDPYVYFNE